MAIVKMKKVTLVGPISKKDAMISFLQKLGSIHLVDIRGQLAESDLIDDDPIVNGDPDITEVELEISHLNWTINYLNKVENKSVGFIEGFLSNQVEISKSDYEEALKIDKSFIHQRCRELENEISELSSERDRLRSIEGELIPWIDLDIPLEELGESKRTQTQIGVMLSRLEDQFLNELDPEIADRIYINTVREEQRDKYLLLIYLKEDEEGISPLLSKYNFSSISFPPSLKGTPRQVLDEIRDEVKLVEANILKLKEKSAELLPVRPKLWALHDNLVAEKEKLEAHKTLANTKRAFILEGWIRKEEEPAIKSAVEGEFPDVEMLFDLPSEEDDVPVEIRNPKILRPFEFLTGLFGSPDYHSVDPTPLSALSFCIFFGLCFGDVLYGTILSVLCLLFMRKYKLNEGEKKFFQLFFLTGISTLIIGIITGNWAGDLLTEDYLSTEIAIFRLLINLRKTLMVIDPIERLMILLGVVWLIGVINQLLGIAIKFYDNWRNGRKLSALGDQLTWLLFLPGIIIIGLPFILSILLAKPPAISPSIITFGKILVIGSLGGMLAAQFRFKTSIISKIGTWIIGLYGIISPYGIASFLGDVLSYSRLLVLGLTTSGTAMVINILALVVIGNPLISIIVLIIGHIFNFAINILGAFIHPARLTFLEFYNRFFEGGGKPYKPFRRELRNIRISEEG